MLLFDYCANTNSTQFHGPLSHGPSHDLLHVLLQLKAKFHQYNCMLKHAVICDNVNKKLIVLKNIK